MMKIAVLTATRAEYGLLLPIIRQMNNDAQIEVRVVVTGAHLAPEFGNTYREIEQDGIAIDKKIEILDAGDGAIAVSKTIGNAIIRFADYFEKRRPDALMVLGDRYETLSVCLAAMNAQIPIIHLYGGETTQGAIDEAVRHSISKMSYLHFTSTDRYRKRVIQLGEMPDRVFSVGAIGVENASNLPLMTKTELEKSLGFSLESPYIVGTYHPVTLENETIDLQINELLSAIASKNNYTYIITKANADAGGRRINKMVEAFSDTHHNVHLVDSLGTKRYLSALKYCRMVIGNSSSGITEVPSFHVPTINIGDRQKGRFHGDTVIDCGNDRKSILEAIELGETEEFRQMCLKAENPFEKPHVAETIVSTIKQEMMDKPIDLKKEFYDISFGEV